MNIKSNYFARKAFTRAELLRAAAKCLASKYPRCRIEFRFFLELPIDEGVYRESTTRNGGEVPGGLIEKSLAAGCVTKPDSVLE